MSWLARHDIAVDAVVPFDFPDTGRGMRATRDISVGINPFLIFIKAIINFKYKAWRITVKDPRVFNYISQDSVGLGNRAIISRGTY